MMAAPASILHVLPPEVLVAIFAELPCEDLLRTAATCKTFHSIINDPRRDERCACSCWGVVVQHACCPAVAMQVAEMPLSCALAPRPSSALPRDTDVQDMARQAAGLLCVIQTGAASPKATSEQRVPAEVAAQDRLPAGSDPPATIMQGRVLPELSRKDSR